MKKRELIYNPKITPELRPRFDEFCMELSGLVAKYSAVDLYGRLNEYRSIIACAAEPLSDAELALAFAQNLLLDLLLQDWHMVLDSGFVKLYYNELDSSNPTTEKERIRRRHLIRRDEQLSEPNVRAFINKLEKRRAYNGNWYSIFSLMRDGEELAGQLEKVFRASAELDKGKLSTIIKPYIQVVEPKVRCAETGLLLGDIWRYFRYTWINDYQQVPGRNIQLIIRDKAAKGHPVIGIAALGSSVAQQTVRDELIGWCPKAFVRELNSAPSKEIAAWLLEILDELIKELYFEDLLRAGILDKELVLNPSIEGIQKLEDFAAEAKELHRLNPSEAKISNGAEVEDWIAKAELPLYRFKRAKLLAELLMIRYSFYQSNFKKGTKTALIKALRNNDFQNNVSKLVRKAKAKKIGVDLMDIMVAGAIAPYNHLLGGKLVCMLLASPEIVSIYNRKYESQVSVIASAMRGKRTVRKPRLAFLGTTSLFGVGSSQYNRIKIPANKIMANRNGSIEYKKLGKSQGFGTFHFTKATNVLANTFISRNQAKYQKVNRIFGEGANPKMRLLRDAISLLGLDSTKVLKHSNYRVVYGIPLITNLKEYLLGIQPLPRYIIPGKGRNIQSKKIIGYWMERWLFKRIRRQDVLERVRLEVKSYPIKHRARVPIKENKEPDLFTGLE